MGLTHYWRRPTELPARAFQQAIDDCRKMLSMSPVGVAGFDGTGPHVLSENQIVFNGCSPQACEPFELARVEFDRHGRPEVFGYCKTEHLPYDLNVQASLIIFHYHFHEKLRVSSDAPEPDWYSARELVQKSLGYGDAFTLEHDHD